MQEKAEIYKEKTQQGIEEINSIIEQIKMKHNMFNKIKKIEIESIVSCAILKKVEKLIKTNLEDEENNLVLLTATLRFTLETLIITNLILIDKDYTTKLYYLLDKQQEDKLKKIIKKIEKEMELLRTLENEEKKIIKRYSSPPSQFVNFSEEEMLKEINEKNELIEQVYENSRESITIFFGGVETNGFGFHRYLVEEQILNEYKDELKQLEEKMGKIELENQSEENPTNSFYTDLQKSVGKSWSKKAEIAGLKDEYEFTYSYISSLMHATSYAFLTPTVLNEAEVYFIYRLLFQYVEKIKKNIIDLNELNKIKFYRIKDE